MKVLITAIFLLFFFTSCDPDVAGEKITLPSVTFVFKVSNDTSYLRVGDTLNMRAAVSSTIAGITLTDGEGLIAASITRSENIPRISVNDGNRAVENVDYNVIINSGGVQLADADPAYINRFTGRPFGDSIIMDYSFVLLKPGLYKFGGFQPSFYEGTKGKGRWDAYFDVQDPRWDFMQIPDVPNLQPGDYGYLRSYLVAVNISDV